MAETKELLVATKVAAVVSILGVCLGVVMKNFLTGSGSEQRDKENFIIGDANC